MGLVEVMGADVGQDCGWEEVDAGVVLLEPVAEIGCGDVFVDGVEEVDAAELKGREVEGGEVVEGESGAADDDPVGEGEEAIGLVPMGEVEEGVCADEDEEDCVGVVGLEGGFSESGEGVDGVVGGAVEAGCVEV